MAKFSWRPVRGIAAAVLCFALPFTVSVIAEAAGTVPRIAQSTSQPAQPNIVFILLDDMGYDSFYDKKIIKPNIDRLQRAGLTFSHFYTSPYCSPTRASLLTGQFAVRHNFRRNAIKTAYNGINPDTRTVADLLKDAGYVTTHIGKWHLGRQKPDYQPTNFGFDHSVTYYVPDYVTTSALAGEDSDNTYFDPIIAIDGNFDQARIRRGEHKTDVLTDEAIDFINTHARTAQPFFVNLWFNAPHSRYHVTDYWRARYNYPDSDTDLYRAMISHADASIGRVLAALEQNNVLDDTIVIVTSDNGAVVDLHAPGEGGTLRGGKAEVFEGGIRQPLIVHWPRGGRSGEQDRSIIAAIDIKKTFARLAGNRTELSGNSFHNQITGSLRDIPRLGPLIWEIFDNRFGIMDGKYKYYQDRSGLYDGQHLYNIEDDPLEQNNLMGTMPDLAATMREKFHKTKVNKTTIDWWYPEAKPDYTLPLNIDYRTEFDFANSDFTVAASVKLTRHAGQVIASRGQSWKLFVDAGMLKLEIQTQTGATHTFDTGFQVPLGIRTNLVLTAYYLGSRSGFAQRIRIHAGSGQYPDLVHETEITGAFRSSSEAIRVGYIEGSGDFFGAIRGLRLHSAALHEPEIRQLYKVTAPTLVVNPGDNITLSGPVGGPFSVQDRTFALSNPGASPLKWRVRTNTPWLGFNGAIKGTLLSGQSHSLDVQLTDAVNDLPPGTHRGRVKFVNKTTGIGTTFRYFTVRIQ